MQWCPPLFDAHGAFLHMYSISLTTTFLLYSKIFPLLLLVALRTFQVESSALKTLTYIENREESNCEPLVTVAIFDWEI